MITVGNAAPSFTLPDQDGKNVSLQDFLGKWVVVYFYPKDDTPGCTVEACSFRDSESELTEAGIIVIGISKDSVASHKKFADKFNLKFHLLADPSTEVIQAYGAWQEKSMYGKKFMGIQRSTALINPEGKITKIFPKVTPKDHAKEILKAIAEI
jgi:thioredoxin-dependent peroxiredoxin